MDNTEIAIANSGESEWKGRYEDALTQTRSHTHPLSIADTAIA